MNGSMGVAAEEILIQLSNSSDAVQVFMLRVVRSDTLTFFINQINSHPANWSVDFRRFCEIALVGLKSHKIGVAAIQDCLTGAPPDY